MIPAMKPVFASFSGRIEFTSLHADDIDAVLAIEQRIYAFPWSRGNFVDSLASGYSAWLMRDEGEMLGYAVMTLVVDEAQLLNISIVAERQRAGFGSLLLEYLFDVARSQGALRMFLEVRPSNDSGLALYRRYGFAQVGMRADYYPAQQGREVALVLAKDL